MTLGPDPLREKIRDLVDDGFEVSFRRYDDDRGLHVTLELPINGEILYTAYAFPGRLIDREQRDFPVTYALTQLERKVRNELLKDT